MPALSARSMAWSSGQSAAAWTLAVLDAKPAWRETDNAAEGCMENDMSAMLSG